MDVATTLAVVAAIVSPLGAYLVAARQFSGRVATSDASDLWEESRSIRQWSLDRISTLNETVAQLENRVRDLEKKNMELARELQDCRDRP